MKKLIKIGSYSCDIDCFGNIVSLVCEGTIQISKDELNLIDFDELRNSFCEMNIPEKKIDLSLASEKQLIEELEKRINKKENKKENLKKFRLKQIFGDTDEF